MLKWSKLSVLNTEVIKWLDVCFVYFPSYELPNLNVLVEIVILIVKSHTPWATQLFVLH